MIKFHTWNQKKKKKKEGKKLYYVEFVRALLELFVINNI